MLKEKLEKFFKIDRRWIFMVLAVVLAVPVIRPLGLPNKTIARDTLNGYKYIEALPAGSFVMLSLDYDPSVRPELHPQAMAIVRHAFRKNLRLAVVTYVAGSTGLIEQIFETVPKESGKVYGKDYVIFPYMANAKAVMTQMATNMYVIYDKDKDGADAKTMPVMAGVKSYKDMSLVVCITGVAMLDYWVAYAGDKFNVPVLGGVTAIIQPGFGPYLQNKQLKGLIGGIKGAAEYEALINIPEKGTSGIDALNLAHILVVMLILVSNSILLVIKFL